MKVLVAGVGNIFFGDDAFGVEVVRAMARSDVGDGVTVAEYGIRGIHLAYELLDGYDALVLVDAVATGEAPGTVVVMEVDPAESPLPPAGDAHSLTPAAVLGTLAGLGGHVEVVRVVGCEPATLDEGIGLSPAVAAAIPAGVQAVRDVLASLRPPG